MTRLELLHQLGSRLEAVGKPALEARWLMEHALGLEAQQLLADLEAEVSAELEVCLEADLTRRLEGYPLQLILGEAGFFGLKFKVREGVLIPRPETEGLVELGLKLIRSIHNPRVLDVGTGSGIIAITLKHLRPDAQVWATDVDANALALAQENASRLNAEIELFQQSYTANLNHLDLVISNPPYLAESYMLEAPPELAYENPSALYSGRDGLQVPRQLLIHARQALKAGAYLAMELSPDNVHILAREALSAGWVEVEVQPDLAGLDRYVIMQTPR